MVVVRLTVHDFCFLTPISLYWSTGPLSWPVDDVNDWCIITFQEVCTIQHCVLASDRRTYDAHALQKWLRCCKTAATALAVVPGCDIAWVECRPLVATHVRRMLTQFWSLCATGTTVAQSTVCASIVRRLKTRVDRVATALCWRTRAFAISAIANDRGLAVECSSVHRCNGSGSTSTDNTARLPLPALPSDTPVAAQPPRDHRPLPISELSAFRVLCRVCVPTVSGVHRCNGSGSTSTDNTARLPLPALPSDTPVAAQPPRDHRPLPISELSAFRVLCRVCVPTVSGVHQLHSTPTGTLIAAQPPCDHRSLPISDLSALHVCRRLCVPAMSRVLH